MLAESYGRRPGAILYIGLPGGDVSTIYASLTRLEIIREQLCKHRRPEPGCNYLRHTNSRYSSISRLSLDDCLPTDAILPRHCGCTAHARFAGEDAVKYSGLAEHASFPASHEFPRRYHSKSQ